jgi:inosine-uridine nucleoside N-ribohydrolase
VPSRPLDGTNAVGFIVDTCRATEGAWIVAVGPLTNVALALRAAPDLAGRIAGISIMGGGAFGNRTPVAEFNIWCDPEAAAVVFGYGGPLVMAGLDLTHQLLATPPRIAALRARPGRAAAVFADLFGFYAGTFFDRHDETVTGGAVHDPCAVLALTHPELFEREARHVAIETAGRLTRGMTVIDRRTLKERPAPTCDVLTRIDADAAWDVIVEAIAALA